MEINLLIEEGLIIEPDADWLQSIVEKTLLAEAVPPNAEISLVVTGQERIQELNREYRGLDKPTDVLSFSLRESSHEEEPTPFLGPPDGQIHLGEIIISYPQAEIQAKEQGHSIKKEMAILAVHGVLHILGYDHEQSGMASVMQAREKEILKIIGEE